MDLSQKIWGQQHSIVSPQSTAATWSDWNVDGFQTGICGSNFSRFLINQPKEEFFYKVQFKRTSSYFKLSKFSAIDPRTVRIGDYVITEADRGEDIGTVFEISRNKSGVDVDVNNLKGILRFADEDDISKLPHKYAEELLALVHCRESVSLRGLPMVILEAEYQYDRNKLTFYYKAPKRIDFRELVSDLFSVYKTRIWMQQLDLPRDNHNNSGESSLSPQKISTSSKIFMKTTPAIPRDNQPRMLYSETDSEDWVNSWVPSSLRTS
jgi:hypothetical protein